MCNLLILNKGFYQYKFVGNLPLGELRMAKFPLGIIFVMFGINGLFFWKFHFQFLKEKLVIDQFTSLCVWFILLMVEWEVMPIFLLQVYVA